MTNKEALAITKKVIESFKHIPEEDDVSYMSCIRDALEKQIPMRPGVCGRERYCTACETKTSRRIVMFWEKYCPDCGQAVDWREAATDEE